MATANQLDMIQRIIRTHNIPEGDVLLTVGSYESLSDEQAKKVICSLADGKFGGIASPNQHNNTLTPRQHQKIYWLAERLYGPTFISDVRAFMRQIYSEEVWVQDLTCRRATRIIAELDRKLDPHYGRLDNGTVEESPEKGGEGDGEGYGEDAGEKEPAQVG